MVTLGFLIALLSVMMLGAVYAARAFVVEARSAANQSRYVLAQEAAEAGIEHMLAKMSAGNISPIISTRVVRLQSPITLSTVTEQSYAVSVSPRASGVYLIDSIGCEGCEACSTACPASARITQLSGIVPRLPYPPLATLTARQQVNMTGTSSINNSSAEAGGIAVRSGGAFSGSGNSRTTGPAGTPEAASRVANDSSLAAMDNEKFFKSFFGVDKVTFSGYDDVTKLTSADCPNKLKGKKVFWVEGDCTISSNMTIGSQTDPIILIVAGNLKITGGPIIHGFIYAGDSDTTTITTGGVAQIHGAVASEGSGGARGTVDLFYDPTVLMQAKRIGIYERLPGSWKDF